MPQTFSKAFQGRLHQLTLNWIHQNEIPFVAPMETSLRCDAISNHVQHYIPMKQLIIKLMENEAILDHILRNEKVTDDHLLQDYYYGSSYSKNAVVHACHVSTLCIKVMHI